MGKGRKRQRVLAAALVLMAGSSAEATTFMSLSEFAALADSESLESIQEVGSASEILGEASVSSHPSQKEAAVAPSMEPWLPPALEYQSEIQPGLEPKVELEPQLDWQPEIEPESYEPQLAEHRPKVLEAVEPPITRLDVLRIYETDRALPDLGESQSYYDSAAIPGFGFGYSFQSLSDDEIDIVTAVHLSIDVHPDIAQAIGRFFQSSEQVAVARSGYFPQVTSGIRGGYRSSTGRSEEAFTLSASQVLYDFGKVSSSVDAATSSLDRERAAVLLAVDQLARETARTVIDIQRYNALFEVADEQIEAIAELKNLAAQRAAKGAASHSDEIQAQSRQESARALRLQLQAEMDVWKRSLQSLLGTDALLDISPSFPESLTHACIAASENFAATPEIMIAEAERAEARASIRQARARMLPTLALNAGYEHYLDRPANDIAINDDEDFTVTLSLTTDLFQGGALRAGRRAAGHALQAATATRDAAYLSVTQGLREARDQSRSLAARSAILQDRYQSIVETQKLYRQQYLSLGTRTLLDILNTEQEIHQSRFDRINTVFDLRRLQIDCLYHVGGIRDAFGLSSTGVRGVSLDDVR